MHWLIQDNLINNQQPYIDALSELKISYDLVSIDTNGNMSEFTIKDKMWGIGSVGFVKKILKNPNITPGVNYDPNLFKFSIMLDKYDKLCLNHDARISTIKDAFIRDGYLEFIKPDSGLKLFNARMITKEIFNDFQKRVINQEFSFDKNELIVISKNKKTFEEYRFFIIDGKIITGCQYMFNKKIVVKKEVPDEAFIFVNEILEKWTPSQAFVIDIAYTYYGFKLVELNCINSAGAYLCDAKKIVIALENLYKTHTSSFT